MHSIASTKRCLFLPARACLFVCVRVVLLSRAWGIGGASAVEPLFARQHPQSLV